jgi:penicillin amidase
VKRQVERLTILGGLGVAAAAVAWHERQRRLSSPHVSGRVSIERDAYGIPHITAQSRDDALFGMGYSIAADRLWQMDLLRRTAVGRLS